MTVLAAQADVEILHFVKPVARGRRGFNRRQPTGKPTVFSAKGSLLDIDRLDRVDRHRD